MVHNEDSLFVVYDTAYIVTCKIRGSKQFDSDRVAPNEEFTSYCYPGQIPGNAYAFNSSGFAFTVDALVPKEIATKRMRKHLYIFLFFFFWISKRRFFLLIKRDN